MNKVPLAYLPKFGAIAILIESSTNYWSSEGTKIITLKMGPIRGKKRHPQR